MEYIIVDKETGKIVEHLCGEKKPEGAIEVPDGFAGYIGIKLAAMKDDFSGVKPVSQQVQEGILTIPEGFKINEADDGVIRMNQAEIDADFPPEVWAIPGTFSGIVVHKNFDRFGNFGYFPPENAVKMQEEQPTAYHKAEPDGTWVLDVDRAKTEKLAELDAAFLQWYEKDATVTSSLGFVADSDARAMMDVSGLVTTLEATPAETRGTVAFMDHDNVPHLLTLEQMKTVQLEIIANGQSTYQQKWAMRTEIEGAQTQEELESIEIKFIPLDFTEKTE